MEGSITLSSVQPARHLLEEEEKDRWLWLAERWPIGSWQEVVCGGQQCEQCSRMFGKLSISLFLLIISHHDPADAQKKKEVTCL